MYVHNNAEHTSVRGRQEAWRATQSFPSAYVPMGTLRRAVTSTRAFYRSGVTPFSFVLSGLLLCWVFSPWGPQAWHDTPSLRLIHRILPWPVVSLLFLGYAVLLATRRIACVVIADAIGLALYGIGLVALLITIRFDNPTNPLAIAGVFLACVLHYLALRLAIIQQEAP